MKSSRSRVYFLRFLVLFVAPVFLLALLGAGIWRTKGRTLPRRLQEPAKQAYYAFRDVLLSSRGAVTHAAEHTDEPMVIYSEVLTERWLDWSWVAHEIRSDANARKRLYALFMSPVAYKGVYLSRAPFDTAGYGAIELYAHRRWAGYIGLTIAAARTSDNESGGGARK